MHYAKRGITLTCIYYRGRLCVVNTGFGSAKSESSLSAIISQQMGKMECIEQRHIVSTTALQPALPNIL